MRFLAIIYLVVATVAERMIENEGFRAGKQYSFVYDGQLSTGFSQQFSTTRIRATVLLSFNTKFRMQLQLTNVRMGKMNQKVPDIHRIFPLEAFEEVVIEEEQDKMFKLPLWFGYKHGLISDLIFDQDEQSWSANIKRGIMNLLQVELSQKERISNEHGEFFVTRETTLEGNCETAYSIVKDGQDKINVTKTINFDKCDRRPEIRYNFQPSNCEDGEEKLLKSSSVFQFGIYGSFYSFVIESVNANSRYSFVTLDENDHTIDTFVRQALILVDVRPIRREIVETSSEEIAESELIYSMDWDITNERFLMLGDDTVSPYLHIVNKAELVVNIVRRLIDYLYPPMGIDAETPKQMSRLVDILRMCTGKELDAIRDRVGIDGKHHKMVGDLLTHALAMAGTKNTIAHLVEHVKTTDIHPVKMALALWSLKNVVLVSEQQIDLLLDLCQHRVSRRNPLLEQSCYLTVGSMMHRLCGHNEDKVAGHQKRCSMQLKQRYIDNLLPLVLSSSSTLYRRLLGLKSLGNAGMDLSLFSLEPIIVDRLEHPLIRRQAIEAVRLLSSKVPAEIVKVLMPVFSNEQEEMTVRMSAVVQIMNTRPDIAVLRQIIGKIRSENYEEFAVFVHTMLEDGIPLGRQIVKDLHFSLFDAKQIPSKSSRKSIVLPYYANSIGGDLSVDLLFNNNSFVPREVGISLDTILREKIRKVLQLSFVQQNATTLNEQLFDRTHGRGSIFKKMLGFDDQSEYESMALLYTRFKDQDFAFMDSSIFPENPFKELAYVQKLLAHGHKMNYYMADFVYESRWKTATSLGVPLIFHRKMPTVISIEGHFGVKAENEAKAHDIVVKIDTQTRIATTLIEQINCWTPIANNGLKVLKSVQFNLPTNVEMSLNLPRMSTVWKLAIPQQQIRIAALQTRSMSFTRLWSEFIRTFSESNEKTIIVEAQETKIDRNFGGDEFGWRTIIKGRVHNELSIGAHNNLEFSISPGVETPELVGQRITNDTSIL